jgi:hypothetical protein
MRDILDFRNFWFVAAQTPKDSDSFALSAGFGWKFCLRKFQVTCRRTADGVEERTLGQATL